MRIRKLVLFVSLSCLLGAQVVHAQALLAPAESFVINRAEAAIITRVAISRGFAANDPRIAATLTGMGEASTALNIVSTGTAVGLGFAGAPVWLTIAAGLGILAAGSALYAGGVSLARSSDGKTISAQQPMPALPSYTGPVDQPTAPAAGQMQTPFEYGVGTLGMQVYRTSACMATDAGCSKYPPMPSLTTPGLNFVRDSETAMLVLPSLAAVQAYDLYEQQYNGAGGVIGGGTATSGLGYDVVDVSVSWQPNADHTNYTLMESRTLTTWKTDLNGNLYKSTDTGTQPVTWWAAGPAVKPISGGDLSQVYPQLTQASLNQPLDPSTLAQLTNQTWQQAAQQPDYQGLPYSVTQPVSPQDVQPWALSNPGDMPNVGDLFTPAAAPGTSTVTISPTVQPGQASSPNPSSSPTTSAGNDVNVVNTPNVNVVNKVSVDLGSDPGVQSPALEATPTISMILSPLLNLLPDLRHWAVPAHSSVCPEPSFTAFGHSFTLTTQCDLAESNRTAIYTAFAAMFTLAALFVVLRA
ncbi:hypothetical protein C0Z18_09760 [Trinickia dabaoshanensis]|uniref:Uncharacterized protein n=1 Tax=Trinickia dabaoshanensis TaxID=564714 RepID=A0A2N7VUI2_9BURK|nr:hypothetical protein [Trinickia dabaoshanensis]PMS20815.1 hypothetical protein C0Z18_09760 [Trinickia dabaoshanensis]